MAITTYDELKTAVANWLKRSDLTSRIPEFIAMAEAWMNRELRLRPQESDESPTGVVGSRYIALPSGFVEPLGLWINYENVGRIELTRVIAEIETQDAEGEPQYWTIDGANVAFERPCDQAYSFTLRCLKTFALSTDSPTNTLLSSDPDLYLAATLAEGFAYALEEDRATFWTNKRDVIADAVSRREAQSRKAPLRTDPALRGRETFNIYAGR